MARVSENFECNFPSMKQSELHNPVIFVVDMVNGFVKEGALHDEAINDITPAIVDFIKDGIDRSVFIADSHPPKTREFNSYPSHCVIGTSESEIISELTPYVQEVIRKNSTNTFTAPGFQTFVKEELSKYNDIVITGCCTDICILQFALCLNSWLNEHNAQQQRVIVPVDMVDTFHIDGAHDCVVINEFSLLNMQANGITIVSTIERGK